MKKQLKPIVLLATILTFAFPNAGLAEVTSENAVGPIASATISTFQGDNSLPEIGPRQARRTMKIIVSAYNSLPEQTDDTPWITASGTTCRDGVLAANFLPIGAIVRFPDVYGNKEFRVEDRMNARYYYRADIWMAEKTDAIKFGAKYLKVEIL